MDGGSPLSPHGLHGGSTAPDIAHGHERPHASKPRGPRGPRGPRPRCRLSWRGWERVRWTLRKIQSGLFGFEGSFNVLEGRSLKWC